MSTPLDTAFGDDTLDSASGSGEARGSDASRRGPAPWWQLWRRPLRTLVLLVVAGALYAVATGGRLPVPGRTVGFVVVAGHSMDPTLATGDLVFYASAPAYHRGEIVVFDHPEPPHKQVIHRIVDVTDRGFVTRGDNRPTTDGTVAPEHVHGTLALRVPSLGYAIVILQGALHVLFGTIGGWCMLAGLALGAAAWRFAQSEL